MGWVSPTGNNDPSGKWSSETLAYDENEATYAYVTNYLTAYSWSGFIELTHASMFCSKVRFKSDWILYGNHKIDVDVYYGDAWHHVYEGYYTFGGWTEKLLSSVQTITKFRFRYWNNCPYTYEEDTPILYEVDFFEFPPPTVTTQAVTDITHNSATGNGNITAIGGENATKRGICWNTTGNPTVADDKSEETGSFGIGAFTRPMTGLDPGVKYYVKAYAYNSAGYGYGSEVNFTTDKIAPTVTTQDATEVSQNQVKGNGNITASGGENATERGFEYGYTKTATWTKKETGSYEAGAFNLTIDGLQANTEYWYRAYAVNSIGTGYGEWIKFQTSATGVIPTGTKLSICSDYSGYTYKLNSAFTDDGNGYESYFVLSTDLAQKQGLHIYKRLEDIFSYFAKKESGTAKIYVKRDNEAEWQYAGEISMVGDEDIIVKHLPSENVDSVGDVDFLAKHFLIKFVFENDFEFIGLISEAIPEGVR